MPKDDYFVLVYKLLSYLYACLKEGAAPDMEYLSCNTPDFPVGEEYWNYILCHLIEDGYLEGATIVPVLGRVSPVVKILRLQITPKGIEYLGENSMMKKATNFLKSMKESIPGI